MLINDFYPDFTIQPGTSGEAVVGKLLSLVPDLLFIEGNTACLVNPLSSDVSLYAYGTLHVILEAKFRRSLLPLNRVQVEGYNPESGSAIIEDVFNWHGIALVSDRFMRIADRNIGSLETTLTRGEACLRKVEIESPAGYIRVPVNCGQQLYDVVDITCAPSGLSNSKRRVLGITLRYNPARGEYEQKIILGGVYNISCVIA